MRIEQLDKRIEIADIEGHCECAADCGIDESGRHFSRLDQDRFTAEIFVEVDGATQVRLHDGQNWVSLDSRDGEFSVYQEIDGAGMLPLVVAQIAGTYVMEITTGKVIAYAFHWTGTVTRVVAAQIVALDGVILRAPAVSGPPMGVGGAPTPRR